MIVVVGVCASGKSTLVKGLNELGYRSCSVAQEHSGIPQLWLRKAPDFLVVLDSSLEIIKKRRLVYWGEKRLKLQRLRLANARRFCNLYLCTDELNPKQVLNIVLRAVAKWEQA